MIAPFRPILLLVAAISFGLGIALPLMRFEKLWFFSETPSLITIVRDLWTQGEILLASVIALFSLVFPVVKMTTTYYAVFRDEKLRRWIAALGKWSMMDVLLVAIVVFAAKTSGLADAISQPGLWFYALSTVCVAIASAGLGSRDVGMVDKP